MVEELVEMEWRVADLREQITGLGLKPKGRTRLALAQQLAEAFLATSRLTGAVAALPEESRLYFTHLLLQSHTNSYYAYPVAEALGQEFPKPLRQVTAPLLQSNLVMSGGEGRTLIPYGTRRRLPHLHTNIPTAAEPEHFVPAADPHELLMQIQQMLGLLQSESFELRPRLRWQAPKYPYAQSTICWPPIPKDAQALYANTERERLIGLQPPDYTLDDTALQVWTEALGASRDWVEFLYHLMVAGGVIWEGSPLTIDAGLVQEWLTIPPGRQLHAIYQLYAIVSHWAAWWPLWRAGTVFVGRAYHGYWGLMSLDDSVRVSTPALREVLLEILSFLPDDTWIALSDLSAWLQRLFPSMESHRYLMGLQLDHIDGGWSPFLEAVVVSMVTGPLRALGLVDVGPALDDVRVLRFHGLQDLQWGRVTEVPVEASAQLHREALRFIESGPSLEVKTPVPPDFMTLVLRWTKPAGFSRSRVRYDLDLHQLYRAFENGESPDTLGEDWQAVVGFEPLPDIRAWWQYWWRRYGRVRIYPPQAMLQTRDALTMQELQISLPSLQAAITSVLTPETALLEPEDVDQVLSNLSRQGYMPKEMS
ncbi:MAG: hypothetical protein MUQ30_02635 [Anaerolineae bacterium]|nr:hypothetical protein [Anaerolineae bacterium]